MKGGAPKDVLGEGFSNEDDEILGQAILRSAQELFPKICEGLEAAGVDFADPVIAAATEQIRLNLGLPSEEQ